MLAYKSNGKNVDWCKVYEDKLCECDAVKVEYSDIFRKGHKNDYSKIKDVKEHCGVYVFENKNKVIYVGQASGRCLYERLKQHFTDRDTGGLRYKLYRANNTCRELENSSLTIYKISKIASNGKINDAERKEILFLETYLIAKHNPKYNFFVDKEE